MTRFNVVPPLAALGYTDTASPENMNVPHPSLVATYPLNAGGTTYYVRPGTGSDANAGTSTGAAKATLFGASGALATAAAGDTINLMDSGLYLEGAGALDKAVTVQAYPLNVGVVYFDGRAAVSALTWTQSGATWWASVTSPAVYADAGEWTNLRQNGINPSATHDPNCVYALPLTIDGVIQLGCGSTGAVDATHAFHDLAADRIYVGQNPSGKTIKMPMRQYAFAVSAAATIRGIVVRCYAAEYGGTAAMVKGGAGAWVFDNCCFGFSASDNVNTTGAATAGTYVRCTSVYGLTGWSAQSSASGVSWIDCHSYKNNLIWKYCPSWHDGGWKSAVVTGFTWTWCTAEANYGHGFWLDFSGSNNTQRRCTSIENWEYGFFHEHTTGADNTTNANRIVGCLAQGNWTGIGFVGAVNTVMVNNTLVNNGIGLRVKNDSRGAPTYCSGLIFENNIISLCPGHTVVPGTAPSRWLFGANDGAETGNFTTAFSSFQNTQFHHDPAVTMPNRISWTINNAAPTNYTTRALWLAGLGAGLDTNGAADVATAGDPYIAKIATMQATTPSSSRPTGKTITALQRDHVGIAAGNATTTAPLVGALQVPGGRMRRFNL